MKQWYKYYYQASAAMCMTKKAVLLTSFFWKALFAGIDWNGHMRKETSDSIIFLQVRTVYTQYIYPDMTLCINNKDFLLVTQVNFFQTFLFSCFVRSRFVLLLTAWERILFLYIFLDLSSKKYLWFRHHHNSIFPFFSFFL